jgi:hypothetical protein
MNGIHLGQKVVVAVPYSEAAHFSAFLNGDVLPVPDVVYTVSDMELPDQNGLVFIRLAEISNPVPDGMEREAAFNSARFRPVVERKTDISQFKAMLTPSKQAVPA